MKVLMTGATGLIGSHIVKSYPQYQYTLLTRSTTHPPNSQQISYINSLNSLANLNDFDAVINLSGEPIMDKRWSKAQRQRIQDSRWIITQQLVDLFNHSTQPPNVFLSGSAIGVYGEMNGQIINEQQLCHNTDFAADLCIKWEEIANKAAIKTRVINLRTGIVLSQKGGALNKMLPLFRLHLGGKIGDGSQYMSWIHIEDMVSAIHYLMTNPQCSGPYNLTANKPVTNQLFSQTLADTLNRKMLLPIPENLLRLMLGDSASLLLASQRIVPKKLIDHGFKFNYTDISHALADLLLTK